MTRRITRIDRILQAQARVELARQQLEQLDALDPRFAGAINEYRAALDDRSVVEKVVLK
jgi:hypothetical protein